MRRLVDASLSIVDWDGQRTGASGTGEAVSEAFQALLVAESDDEAVAAYWELDNRVVVQGQLFKAAVSLIPALLAALLANVAEPARYWLIELLIQIAHGEAHASETDPALVPAGSTSAQRRTLAHLHATGGRLTTSACVRHRSSRPRRYRQRASLRRSQGHAVG